MSSQQGVGKQNMASLSRTRRSRRSVSTPSPAINAGECAVCGSQSTHDRDYRKSPTTAVLSVFRLIKPAISQHHFFCSRCIFAAVKRIGQKRPTAQENATNAPMQLSANEADDSRHRTTSIAGSSQPSNVSSPDVLHSPLNARGKRPAAVEPPLVTGDGDIDAAADTSSESARTVEESEYRAAYVRNIMNT